MANDYDGVRMGLGTVLSSSQAAHDYLMRWFPYWGVERMVTVGLDEGFGVVSVQCLKGGPMGVNMRDQVANHIFDNAREVGAARVIVCHNHPGRSVMPSIMDSETTDEIRRIGKALGITMWDHLILHEELRYSYRLDGGLGDDDPLGWNDASEVEREALCWKRRKWRWQRQLFGEWKLIW